MAVFKVAEVDNVAFQCTSLFVPLMLTVNTKCLKINTIVFQIGNVNRLKILREGCGMSAYLQIIAYIASSVG